MFNNTICRKTLARVMADDRLDLQEVLKTKTTPFTAIARALVTAKGGHPVGPCVIDDNTPGPYLPGNAAGAFVVG